MLCTMSAAPAAKTMARQSMTMIGAFRCVDDAGLLVSPWSLLDFGIFGCTGSIFSLIGFAGHKPIAYYADFSLCCILRASEKMTVVSYESGEYADTPDLRIQNIVCKLYVCCV